MNDIALSQALDKSCREVLRNGIDLMDNHDSAPGYILFAAPEPEKWWELHLPDCPRLTQEATPMNNGCVQDSAWQCACPIEKKYYAYLVYLPHSEAKIPFIFGFELTEEMDFEGVELAVMEAQDKFVHEIKRLEKLAKAEIVSVVGENKDPVLWTGSSLSHFGKNPFGQDIWRVVWAPTRLYLIGGRWTDRKEGKIVRTVDEYRWIQRYGEERGWILEKWLSAMEYAGPKELWLPDEETGLYELGPYPSRGEYESCWTFPVYPNATSVDTKIQMIVYGKQKFNVNDIRNAHRLALEGKEAARDNNLEAMIRDAMPAFPMRGMSGSPYRSAPDDFKVSTKDLRGMPDSDKDFKQLGNDPIKVN